MRKESELSATIDTARQAEAIINHPLHIAAIESMKQDVQEKFKALANSELIAMQECNLKLKIIDEFEETYLSLISNGNSALESLETLAEFKKATKQ